VGGVGPPKGLVDLVNHYKVGNYKSGNSGKAIMKKSKELLT